MFYTLLHRSADNQWTSPIPDVLAERIHRLPEPPVDDNLSFGYLKNLFSGFFTQYSETLPSFTGLV